MVAHQSLQDFFLETRAYTENICKPLEIEDYVVQPVANVSPPKWHLGHTTWFFEEFILKDFKKGYTLFSDDFAFVFNSYYESVGKRVVRTDRGNLSRPTVSEVYDYRRYVTKAMQEMLTTEISTEIEELLTIGIHHEKQHQELLITDIKYILGNNPLMPSYGQTITDLTTNSINNNKKSKSPQWISIPEGLYNIGHDSKNFCYDNELGAHKVFLPRFEISDSLITNRDWISFIEAGGYHNTLLWHAEGWDWVNNHNIQAPMYWHLLDNVWHHYTLKKGLQKVDLNIAVAHISYYEAFAYAQWSGKRLPTEFEWEVASKKLDWGKRWEWTESAYLPYPKYKKAPGALGEYNGKFMVNQKILRGGSIATSKKHIRPTYRNFFQTGSRWQFTGLRLAQ